MHTKITTLLVLLPAVCMGLSSWSPPKTLFSNRFIFLGAVYTDPSTGIHHLLWSHGNVEEHPVYSSISPTGEVLTRVNSFSFGIYYMFY